MNLYSVIFDYLWGGEKGGGGIQQKTCRDILKWDHRPHS